MKHSGRQSEGRMACAHDIQWPRSPTGQPEVTWPPLGFHWAQWSHVRPLIPKLPDNWGNSPLEEFRCEDHNWTWTGSKLWRLWVRLEQIRGGHYLNWLSSDQLDWIVTETQVVSEYWSQTWHGPTGNIQSLDLMKDLAAQSLSLWAKLKLKWLNSLDGLKVVVERRAKVIVHHHERITGDRWGCVFQSYNP